jgi:hypothetical protein
MKIVNSSLTATNQGDGFVPLERARRRNPDHGNFTGSHWDLWSANNPHTWTWGLVDPIEVRMWTKGVKIDGMIFARDANDATRPDLNGACNLWEMGLLQVIRTQPAMKAVYENGLERQWRQRFIPCYDSNTHASRPWYNPDTKMDIEKDAAAGISFVDLPCAYSLMRLQHQGRTGRLIRCEKKIQFRTYLAVRKKNQPQGASPKKDLVLVRELGWSTHTVLEFDWTANDNVHYTANTFTRSKEASSLVDSAKSTRILSSFPSDGSPVANSSIAEFTYIHNI